METSTQPFERFEQLPLRALRESARNTRRTYNESRLAELTESIRQKGIISPLIARPLAGEDGFYEIAAGHRRFRAARLADLATAPVIIREYTDEEFLEVLTIENLQREDVHPMEEAEGYAELLKRPGYDVALLAQKVGKTDSYIYQRLKLLELVPVVRELFISEKIHIGHAILLARLQPDTQKKLAEDLDDHRGGIISVAALKNEIERNVYLDLNKASFQLADPQLLPKAGSCMDCLKRSGANLSLFKDIAAKDVCLDRACYYQKQNAHASAQSAKLTKELGERPLWVSTANKYTSEKKKEVLHEDEWRYAPKSKGCDHAKKAVVVEVGRWSGDKYTVGDVIQVCANRNCRLHWGSPHSPTPRPERTAAELKRELAVKEKEEAEEAVRRAMIAAAVDAAVCPITGTALRELARVMWQRLWHDHRVKVLARRGLKQASSRDHNATDVMREEIADMNQDDLAGLITEIAIMESGGGRAKEDGPDMLEIALTGVGESVLEAIERDARETVKAEFDKKRNRIDQAEAKVKALAKKTKETMKANAAAQTAEAKNQPAAPAKKGKKK